jgi:hypothetical protein
MDAFDLDRYVARSRALDLTGIDWDAVPRYPLPAAAVRVLRYMQDIESHTIVYLRQLLATRAIDDPEVSTFLACWIYEETFHGRALDRFLEAAGEPRVPRAVPRSHRTLADRLEALASGILSRTWPDFVALHMTWGAVNELTTLTGYRRLSKVAAHPVLTELLSRIVRDESRHFFFYYKQAERSLVRPAARRITRFALEHVWAPVGSGAQPRAETRFLAETLLSGPDGRAAARHVDETIRRLPGLEDVRLLEAWVEHHGIGRTAAGDGIDSAPWQTA